MDQEAISSNPANPGDAIIQQYNQRQALLAKRDGMEGKWFLFASVILAVAGLGAREVFNTDDTDRLGAFSWCIGLVLAWWCAARVLQRVTKGFEVHRSFLHFSLVWVFCYSCAMLAALLDSLLVNHK